MSHLEWVFLMQIIMGGVMIFLILKLTQVKKQIDETIREINSYLTYITEVDRTEEKIEKKKHEEAQNQLIQAVLGEFFP